MSVYGVGRSHGRRDVAETILALADDTSRKMRGETSEDEDAEWNYSTDYLLEDLLTRLVEIAEENGADAGLFPEVIRRTITAYALLTPKEVKP